MPQSVKARAKGVIPDDLAHSLVEKKNPVLDRICEGKRRIGYIGAPVLAKILKQSRRAQGDIIYL